MHFGDQPAAAEGLVADAAFFRLPTAWAWARTIVESRMTQSKFGSCTASNRPFRTPVYAQRRQRLRGVSTLPKRAGSVYYAAPWRTTQRTAFKNKRLSPDVRPTPPALPAKCGANNAHVRSLILSNSFTNEKLIARTT